jgi:hypothetical protein
MKEEEAKTTQDYLSPNLKDTPEEGAAACQSGSGASACSGGSGPGGPCSSGSNHSW